MTKRESIDFDFFDDDDRGKRKGGGGPPAERSNDRRPHTRLGGGGGGDDYDDSDNDRRSAVGDSTRSSAATVVAPTAARRIEARVPSVATVGVSGRGGRRSDSADDDSSSEHSGGGGDPPASSTLRSSSSSSISSSDGRRQVALVAHSAAAASRSSLSSSRLDRQVAWSDESDRGHNPRVAGGGVDSDLTASRRRRHADGGHRVTTASGRRISPRQQERQLLLGLLSRQGDSGAGGGTLSDPEITWDDTDSEDDDVSVSPLNSPDSSPIVTPRRSHRAERMTTSAAERSAASADGSGVLAQPPLPGQRRAPMTATSCRVTRSSDEVQVRRSAAAGVAHGSRTANAAAAGAADLDRGPDEDRISMNLLLKALLEYDDPSPKKERRLQTGRSRPDGHEHGRAAQSPMLEAEHRRLLQNLLGLTDAQQQQQLQLLRLSENERRTRTKSSREAAAPRVTNASVNRAREQRRIELENLALLKRLQSAKPTRELQRKAQLQDYYRQMSYHAPQLRGGDAGSRGLSSTSSSAAAASCYGSKLGNKSQSLQSLRSAASSGASSQRSTARVRPASASRGIDRGAAASSAASANAHKGSQSHNSRVQLKNSAAEAARAERLDETFTRWEDGW